MMTTLYSLNKINKFFVYSNGVDRCLSSIGFVTWVCAPRFFVSSQQKFGMMDIKACWWVTALGGQTLL